MGRFWIDDDFVRKHIQTHKLSLKAIAVFMALCSHADSRGFCFVGVRLLGKELGINKETAGLAVNELTASGLVGRCKKGKHGVSGLTIVSVRKDSIPVSGGSVPKEVISEGRFKERENSERIEKLKSQIRAKFSA
jgi:hypothetical protein